MAAAQLQRVGFFAPTALREWQVLGKPRRRVRREIRSVLPLWGQSAGSTMFIGRLCPAAGSLGTNFQAGIVRTWEPVADRSFDREQPS
jgi:hypothetical protein